MFATGAAVERAVLAKKEEEELEAPFPSPRMLFSRGVMKLLVAVPDAVGGAPPAIPLTDCCACAAGSLTVPTVIRGDCVLKIGAVVDAARVEAEPTAGASCEAVRMPSRLTCRSEVSRRLFSLEIS